MSIATDRLDAAARIRPSFAIGKVRIFIYALVLVLTMFVLLPFTQYLSDIGKKSMTVRSVDVSLPPPEPPDFMQDIEPPSQTDQTPPPEFQEPPPMLNLSQLEMAINPGVGNAMAGAFDMQGFDLKPSNALADLQIFEISDLDSTPKLRKGARPVYPASLRSERVGGVVRLRVLLDVNGHVTVLEVLESDRKEFEQPAIEAAEQFIYDAPTKDGKPVNTQFILPIRFAIN